MSGVVFLPLQILLIGIDLLVRFVVVCHLLFICIILHNMSRFKLYTYKLILLLFL